MDVAPPQDAAGAAAAEVPSLVVTTVLDVVDDMDGLTSLREAIAFADLTPDTMDEITFSDGSNGTHNFYDATPDVIALVDYQLDIKSDLIHHRPRSRPANRQRQQHQSSILHL